MKKSILFLLIAASLLSAAGLGVNISLPERGGTFVDMIKEHHRWLNPSNWSSLDDDSFDALGWPTMDAMLMMDLRPATEWSGSIDDPEAYRVDLSGTYSGSLTGKATVQSRGEGSITNVTYDEASNTTTFNWVVGKPGGDGYGFCAIAFIDTRRTPDDAVSSGFTTLKLIRPGYDADTEQTFLDSFIDALTNPKFSAIRFKDFTATDGVDPEYPGVTEWADRSLPTHAAQTRIGAINKRGGAAWDYVIELANLTGIDPWINIPVSATDDYVTQLATMFKENLNPDLNIYLESSNEVWNTAPGYEQTQYSKAQADALGIDERENHARRTVEIAQLFESVYGAGSLNSKIRVILCSHAPMLKWWVQGMLDYIKNNIGPVNQYVYALACQSYFSGGADAGESVDKILADCRASITSQMDEPSGNQSGRKQWIAKAQQFGLVGGFCFYEGGPDHGGGSTTNLANRINAERSQDMGDVFKYNYKEAFFDLGGNLAIQFTLTSAYNRYGCWGMTDDINNPDRNYKFQAARDLLEYLTTVETKSTVEEFRLNNNYPNPFNPSTQISFSIPHTEHVTLNIFNVRGEHVTTLVDEQKSQGEYVVTFDASGLPGGVYLYELRTDARVEVRKCLLVK